MDAKANADGIEAKRNIPESERQKLYLGSYASAHERDFALACQTEGLPEPETQYKFSPTRKFRADFAWPSQRVLVEVEGGEWAGGRHVRGAGYTRDCHKYNLAVSEGWRLLRFTGGMIAGDPCGCALRVKELLEQDAGWRR